MTTYSWSTITTASLAFTSGDVVNFDAGGSAAQIGVSIGQAVTTLTFGGKSIGLPDPAVNGAATQFLTLDGSRLVIDAVGAGIHVNSSNGVTTDDHIVGFKGATGADNVIGFGGADIIIGGGGADYLAAGVIGGLHDSYIGNASINGALGDDFISGEIGRDSLFGGQGADTIYAGDGNSSVNGNLGNDSIIGGKGEDSIFGGQGNDTIYGDSSYSDNTANNTVGKAETISGDLGNDSIVASSSHSDTILGGDGNDTVVGAPPFSSAHSDSINGNAGDDSLSGDQSDSDSIFGGQGNDTIFANGADSISGDLGNDRIDVNSRYSLDTVSGGAGNDTIVFGAGVSSYNANDATGAGVDVVLGFTTGQDKILLDLGSLYSSSPTLGFIALPTVYSSYAAGAAAARNAMVGEVNTVTAVVAAQIGADIYLFVDTAHDAGASLANDQVIKLMGVGDIHASDLGRAQVTFP